MPPPGVGQLGQAGVVFGVVVWADPEQVTGRSLDLAHVTKGMQRINHEDYLPHATQRFPLGPGKFSRVVAQVSELVPGSLVERLSAGPR